MPGIFAFKCSTCGKVHEGSPNFGYSAPGPYSALSDTDKAKAKLTSDTCEITHSEGTDRFIRVVLEIPILGVEEPFTWGVWVSLSEASFDEYLKAWDDPDENASYFGWFCNQLPYYENTINLKTQVRPRKGGIRPYLELEPNGHLLSKHLYEGISVELAQEIAENAMHGG